MQYKWYLYTVEFMDRISLLIVSILWSLIMDQSWINRTIIISIFLKVFIVQSIKSSYAKYYCLGTIKDMKNQNPYLVP